MEKVRKLFEEYDFNKNGILDKDEFIIKADDSVLEQVTNEIKNRVQLIEQYGKHR